MELNYCLFARNWLLWRQE